jgi:hypothetical protein
MSKYKQLKKPDTGQKKTYYTTDNFFGVVVLPHLFIDFNVEVQRKTLQVVA